MWFQRIFRATLLVATVVVLGTGAGACDTPTTSDCVCTQEFRFLIITVHDASGQPVTGVAITVTQVSNGTVIPVQQGSSIPGTYIILDDSFKSRISSTAETIRVMGQKGAASFNQNYSVQVDRCGCHVMKVSGPDVVTL